MEAIFTAALEFLTTYAVELGAGGAVLGMVEWVFAPFRSFRHRFKKPEKVIIANPDALAPSAMLAPSEPMVQMSLEQFEEKQRKLRDDITEELKQAHAEDRAQLQAKLDAVNARLAEPETALDEAQKRIRDLEALLDRAGNEIGGDRLAEAKTALEAGDYSVADETFAEIEAKEAMAVQSAARAAFGRGEIAEAEVRWLDAADHYARAARLEESFEHLRKAADLAERSGDYDTALMLGAQALELARGKGDGIALAEMLAEQGVTLQSLGHFDEAEALYRQAMQITKDALGETHPNYGTRLNNLAGVLQDTGRFDEAEVLYRQDMRITKDTLGETHPSYGTSLNNLALNHAEQRRFDEAIPLMAAALGIRTKALGADHPHTIGSQSSLDAMKAAKDAF